MLTKSRTCLLRSVIAGNEMTAELFVSSAYKIYVAKLGTEHKSSQDVRTMLAAIRQTVDTFEADGAETL